MKQNHSASKMLLINLCCCLFMSLCLGGCGNNANVRSTDNRSATRETSDDGSAPATQQSTGRNSELCRKVDSCGCQTYEQCMAAFENDPYIDQEGVRECMVKSSCQSLCAGKPDGCPGVNRGAGNPGTDSRRSNCAAIPCSKSSDCPSDCYGGCDGVICYSF